VKPAARRDIPAPEESTSGAGPRRPAPSWTGRRRSSTEADSRTWPTATARSTSTIPCRSPTTPMSQSGASGSPRPISSSSWILPPPGRRHPGRTSPAQPVRDQHRRFPRPGLHDDPLAEPGRPARAGTGGESLGQRADARDSPHAGPGLLHSGQSDCPRPVRHGVPPPSGHEVKALHSDPKTPYGKGAPGERSGTPGRRFGPGLRAFSRERSDPRIKRLSWSSFV
jgi:hypothetical protein